MVVPTTTSLTVGQPSFGLIRKLRIPNASVEIKKANLYGASTEAALVRFSNAAAVNVTLRGA
jgi:hypothetical protein